MTDKEINEINAAAIAKLDANKALLDDSDYKKELFREHFDIDALRYFKYEMMNRLHCFQSEQDYFRRQAEESNRKLATATDNIRVVLEEIKAIESVIAEKRNQTKVA